MLRDHDEARSGSEFRGIYPEPTRWLCLGRRHDPVPARRLDTVKVPPTFRQGLSNNDRFAPREAGRADIQCFDCGVTGLLIR
jgi:hypothetical protein